MRLACPAPLAYPAQQPETHRHISIPLSSLIITPSYIRYQISYIICQSFSSIQLHILYIIYESLSVHSPSHIFTFINIFHQTEWVRGFKISALAHWWQRIEPQQQPHTVTQGHNKTCLSVDVSLGVFPSEVAQDQLTSQVVGGREEEGGGRRREGRKQGKGTRGSGTTMQEDFVPLHQ